MPMQSTTKKNHTSLLIPPILPSMPWRVTNVDVLPNYRLQVRFVDGLEGIVDMSALIRSTRAGVFAALANKDLFQQASIEYGAVTWPGHLDLAPDAMHHHIKTNHGEWVVGA